MPRRAPLQMTALDTRQGSPPADPNASAADVQPDLPPLNAKDLTTGLITESAVSQFKAPADTCTESLNWSFDQIGAAQIRAGTTLVGTQLNAGDGTICGVYQFNDTVGGNSQLLAVNNDTVYRLSGNSWVAKLAGLTANTNAEFTTYLNQVFIVNGSNATMVWDGSASAFTATGNASGAPIGKYIEEFRNRVWIAGNATYPSRVWYSSLPTLVATPVITWNTAVDSTGLFIDIAPSDGESITGLKRTKGSLMVFKQNHIYRIFSINETEPDPKLNVGTSSGRSIVETPDALYFHHFPSGFYMYDFKYYGSVTRISKPIIDITKNITVANSTKMVGWKEPDGDHVCWSLGAVTYLGVTYSNLVVRYTISTQTWTHYQYPATMLATTFYNDGTSYFQLCGDSAGNVLKMDTGLTDNSTPISYSLVHLWQSLDGMLSTKKYSDRFLIVHDGATGTNVGYQNENPTVNVWQRMGQLKSTDSSFSSANVNGRKMRLRLWGQSTGQPFKYFGYEVMNTSAQTIQFPTQ